MNPLRDKTSFIRLWAVSAIFFQISTAFADEYDDFTGFEKKGDWCKIKLSWLRPTQFSIGEYEVDERVDKLWDYSKKDLKEYQVKHTIEIVIGPEQEAYLVDGHHLSRALQKLEKKSAIVKVKANLSSLAKTGFWEKMEAQKWVYLKDETGRDRRPQSLPKKLEDLADDPYRSLAWLVAEHDGYVENEVPFQEFKWGEFFRDRIDLGDGRAKDIKRALERALELALSKAAKDLPGYKGPK